MTALLPTQRGAPRALYPLKKASPIAVRRGRSVSSLLAEELREQMAEDAAYTAARKRAFALFPTASAPLWGNRLSRAELHDRHRLR
jgi:hypothetical protein